MSHGEDFNDDWDSEDWQRYSDESGCDRSPDPDSDDGDEHLTRKVHDPNYGCYDG
jgi:hypothetical protein